MLGLCCFVRTFPPSASSILDWISFVLAFPKHDHSCQNQTGTMNPAKNEVYAPAPFNGAGAFSNKDKLQQAGQGKIGRTHTSIVRCILLQARTKKAKCPRQRRLTALARSVQKAARTPSDSQADSVDDYTKAKLKQGCSVRKAARTPSDSQADSIDSAGKSNAAMHGDTQHCGQS